MIKNEAGSFGDIKKNSKNLTKLKKLKWGPLVSSGFANSQKVSGWVPPKPINLYQKLKTYLKITLEFDLGIEPPIDNQIATTSKANDKRPSYGPTTEDERLETTTALAGFQPTDIIAHEKEEMQELSLLGKVTTNDLLLPLFDLFARKPN